MQATETALDIEAYRTLLKNAGIDADRLAVDDKGTLALDVDRVPGAARDLPVLAGELVLRAPIAKGGMGEIHLARQIALGRDVAVKRASVRAQDREHASEALVHEARITGALEHPNIVPIHALGRSTEGDALLVMKRIDGEPWSDLLARRKTRAEELDKHINILIDVCHALHFAHARGVVHRDLKPANVMVGSFGEVYLLDWGIAVTIDSDTLREEPLVPGAPRASDVKGICGTPQFMAPEMAMPGEPCDARTDVFLVGATLHVILTGQPPHKGTGIASVLCAAASCPPPVFGDDVPSELAQICARALSKDRAQRFASAEEMRAALVAFLQHDGARALVVEARAQLAALDKLVAAEGDAPSSERDLDVARAFSAARFGFAAALREWPESSEARRGLRDTITAMARWEISRRHVDAARVLVRELDDASGGVPILLADALRALDVDLRNEAAAKAALEAQARAVDPRVGTATRAVLLAVIMLVWAAFALFAGAQLRAGAPPTFMQLAMANVVMCALFGGASYALYRRNNATVNVNVRYSAMASVDVLLVAAMWIICSVATIPLEAGVAIAHVINACALFGIVWFGERLRMIAAALVMLTGAPLALMFPLYALEVNAVIVVVAMLFIVGPKFIRETPATAS